jgi:hypothetical protein
MFEKRKSIRYPTAARAVIAEISDSQALLKDLSITGCCLEYTMSVEIKPDAQYKARILPDTAAGIDAFDLLVESRWVRANDYSCEVGFAVTMSPKGREFQRYVDYLAWRSAAS